MAWTVDGIEYTTRIKLTIDRSKISATLADFPVLVKLTSNELDFSKSSSGGFDVRFTESDGTTLLKYERERHDSGNSLAEYWVKLPDPGETGDAQDTYFYMYYKPGDETRYEAFLDTDKEDSSSGVSYAVNKPTKYGSNPIFPTDQEAEGSWDYDKYYCKVITHDDFPSASKYRMWYGAKADTDPNEYYICYAYSTDGLSWTKPNINVYETGTWANNNIVRPKWDYNADVVCDPDAVSSRKWVMLRGRKDIDGEFKEGLWILISSDGHIDQSWTQIKEISSWPVEGVVEGMALVKRPDGRWLAYYQVDGIPQRRKIGAFLSDTTDLSGGWTDQGDVIQGADNQDDQRYGLGVEYIGEIYYAVVAHYNKTTERVKQMFYICRNADGLTGWASKEATWIDVGAGGAWDDEMIYGSKGSFVHIGDEWCVYFSGAPENHSYANGILRDARIGLAKIPYQRIGQISVAADAGEGNFVGDVVAPDGKLYVNVDTDDANNKLEVELLDTGDNVVTGYAKADCDDIGVDSYSQEVSWGGKSIPIGNTQYKIKFYLNSATGASEAVALYAYQTVAEDGADPVNVWDANFVFVHHMNDDPDTSNIDDSIQLHDGVKDATSHPEEAAGLIARGQLFDGLQDQITMADAADLSFVGDLPFTIEAWVKMVDATSSCILAKNDPDTNNSEWQFWLSGADKPYIALYDVDVDRIGRYYNTALSEGVWHYLVMVYDGTEASTGIDIYLDDNGAVDDTDYNFGTYNGMRDTPVPCIIGANADDANLFDGYMDEVRLSKTNRSAAWIKASYNSGNDSLLTYGNEEGYFDVVTAESTSEALAPTIEIVTEVLAVTAEATSQALTPIFPHVEIFATTATATSEALVPTLPNATIIGVTATATSEALSPVIRIGYNVAADLATATSEAIVPAVTAEKHIEIIAPIAEATSEAQVPIVSVPDITISAVVATADSEALAPTILAVQNVDITAVTATADGIALAPTITVTRNVAIAAPIATADSEALVPSISAITNVDISAVVAQATSEALAPEITVAGDALVVAVTATSDSQAIVPTIELLTEILAFTATSDSLAIAPAIATTWSIEILAAVATAESQAYAVAILAQKNVNILALTALADSLALPSVYAGRDLIGLTFTRPYYDALSFTRKVWDAKTFTK